MHRWLFFFLFLLSLLMLFFGLGAYDLSAPDEPRFALIAKEMLEVKHWFLLQRNGNLYSDKPPFFFWCIAFLSKLGGEVNAWTARLPSAIAGLGVLFYISRYALQESKNYYVAAFSGFVLLTSFLFFYEARMAQIDMLLCFFLTGAFIECFALMRGYHKSIFLAALWMGLGTITKGPIAFLLPLGACFFYQLLVEKQFRKIPYKAILLSFVIPLIWLFFLYQETSLYGKGEYLYDLVFRQTVVRYANPWHHHRPWYYFLITFFHDFLPWSPFIIGMLFVALRSWRTRSFSEKYAWIVCLFVILFFSISSGKRNLYILPLFPFASYIVALYFKEWVRKKECPAFVSIVFYLLFGVLSLAAIILVGLGLRWFSLPIKDVMITFPHLKVLLVGLSIFIFSWAGYEATKARHLVVSVLVLLLLMVQVNLFLFHTIKPITEPLVSPRYFMQEANYIMNRENIEPIVGMVDFREGFRFYGNQDIMELKRVNDENSEKMDLIKFWKKNPFAWVIIREEYWQEYVDKHSLKAICRYEQKVGQKKYYFLQWQRISIQ